MILGRPLAGAVLAIASALAGPALAVEPQEVIRAFYSEPSVSLQSPRSAGYFARDLDAALKRDSSRPGEVGAVDFDYRYGAQDVEISGLQFVADVDNDQARVVAVFKNFGRAHSVDWSLCRRPDGDWRIADAHSNTGPEEWDLRQMLRLPAEPVRC
jgi:hypothetical protein